MSLRQLDMALERLGVDLFGFGEIAELQDDGIVEIDAILVGMGLDQDSAGPAVADVENEIDRNRFHGRGGADGVDQADGAWRNGLLQEFEENQVASIVLERIREIGLAQGAPGALRLLEFPEQLVEPGRYPVLEPRCSLSARAWGGCAKEPGDVAKAECEAEFMLV